MSVLLSFTPSRINPNLYDVLSSVPLSVILVSLAMITSFILSEFGGGGGGGCFLLNF